MRNILYSGLPIIKKYADCKKAYTNYICVTFLREIHVTEYEKYSFQKKGNMVHHKNSIIKQYADYKRELTPMIFASHSSWSNRIA